MDQITWADVLKDMSFLEKKHASSSSLAPQQQNMRELSIEAKNVSNIVKAKNDFVSLTKDDKEKIHVLASKFKYCVDMLDKEYSRVQELKLNATSVVGNISKRIESMEDLIEEKELSNISLSE